MANVDLSCPLIITVSLGYILFRSNHSVCIVVVSYEGVTVFICLVLEQHYERYCRMTDSPGKREGLASATSL